MLRVILPPLIVILCGGAGQALRAWELSSAFDVNGLAIPNAPATLILIALTLVVAGVTGLLCPVRMISPPEDSELAFSARGNQAYFVICALSALTQLAAALYGLYSELMSTAANGLSFFLWLMCIPCAFCVLITGWRHYRGRYPKLSVPMLAPAYTCCVWLLSAYQGWASEPVTLIFLYQLFSIICTALAVYFFAGFSFGKGSLWCSLFFSLMGIYFNFVTLSDSHSVPTQLLHLFAIMYLLANAVILLRRAFYKEKTSGGHLK